jgi:hypothetical protein
MTTHDVIIIPTELRHGPLAAGKRNTPRARPA